MGVREEAELEIQCGQVSPPSTLLEAMRLDDCNGDSVGRARRRARDRARALHGLQLLVMRQLVTRRAQESVRQEETEVTVVLGVTCRQCFKQGVVNSVQGSVGQVRS